MKMNVKRNATSLNNLECLEKSISTFSSVRDNKFDISNMENSFIFEKSFSFFFFFYTFVARPKILLFLWPRSMHFFPSLPNNFFPLRAGEIFSKNSMLPGGGGGETSRWIFTRSGIHGIRLPISSLETSLSSVRFEFCVEIPFPFRLRIHNYETNPLLSFSSEEFISESISFFYNHR